MTSFFDPRKPGPNLLLGGVIVLVVWLYTEDPETTLAWSSGWSTGYVLWLAVRGEPRRPSNEPPKLC